MTHQDETTPSPLVALFAELMDLPEAARSERLVKIREKNPALAAELERLLSARLRSSLHWSALLKPSGAAESEAKLPAGTRIGRFVVEDVLGSGGMGVVYAGRREDGTIRQEVAIKLSRLNEAEGATVGGVAREAALLSTLRHPGIAQFHDIVPLPDGRLAMIVERVSGQALDKWLKEHAPDTRQTVDLLRAVVESVRYAHGHLVLHGDIKPSNIMLDAHGQPRLLDFGIAVLMTDASGGRAFGASPGYAAPEVLQFGQIDMRSDVYSLGVLGKTLLAHAPPRKTGPYSLDADLRAVLERAVNGIPEQRYPDATSLLADLDAIVERRPVSIPARPPGYAALRLLQRRPTAAGLGLAAVAALLVAVIGIGLALASEERQRIAAQQAERAAIERASELEQVAKFQADQLSNIDAAAMGLDLRNAILAARGEAEHAIRGDADAARNALEQALQGVNFTNVALGSLDRNIFSRAVKTIDERLADQPLLQARLLMALAQTEGELGLYPQALPLGQRVLELLRQHRGADHPDTLTSARGLGMLLSGLGRVEEGGRLIREVYETRERTLPEDHPDRLAAMFSMADQLLAESKTKEAFPLLEKTLTLHRQVLGESDPETLKVMNAMFLAHHQAGQTEQAAQVSGEALEITRRSYGPDDPMSIRAIINRQNALGDLGRTEEAIALGMEMLDITRRTLGDSHELTILSMNNLGMTYANAMRLDEALLLMQEASERLASLFGPDHISTLNARSNLGFIYDGQGRKEEAEAVSREILATARRTLGDDDPFTLRRINDLGVSLMRLGRLDEAEALYRESLEAARRIDGDRHPATLGKIANLADLMRQKGRLEEADALGAESVQSARAVLSPQHPELARYLARHARTLLALNRYEHAQEQFLAAYPVILAAYGAENRLTRQVAEDLIHLFEVRNRTEPGQGFDKEAAHWRGLLEAPQQNPTTP